MSIEWCVSTLFYGLEAYFDSSAVFHIILKSYDFYSCVYVDGLRW